MSADNKAARFAEAAGERDKAIEAAIDHLLAAVKRNARDCGKAINAARSDLLALMRTAPATAEGELVARAKFLAVSKGEEQHLPFIAANDLLLDLAKCEPRPAADVTAEPSDELIAFDRAAHEAIRPASVQVPEALRVAAGERYCNMNCEGLSTGEKYEDPNDPGEELSCHETGRPLLEWCAHCLLHATHHGASEPAEPSEAEPVICRIQFPDGRVPTDIEACAQGWMDWHAKATQRAEKAEARGNAKLEQLRDTVAEQLDGAKNQLDAVDCIERRHKEGFASASEYTLLDIDRLLAAPDEGEGEQPQAGDDAPLRDYLEALDSGSDYGLSRLGAKALGVICRRELARRGGK